MNNEFENLENTPQETAEENTSEFFQKEDITSEVSEVAENSPLQKAEEHTAKAYTEENSAETETFTDSGNVRKEGVQEDTAAFVPKSIPQNTPSAATSPVYSIPANPVPPTYPQPAMNNPYYQAPYGHNGTYTPAQNQTVPPYPAYNPATPQYQMPPAYSNAPMGPVHSKGSKALVVVLWILVALFSLGFFVMCGYVSYRVTETSDKKVTAPTLFNDKDKNEIPSTSPEEEETTPHSDIVEGGVIPHNDKNDYSKESSITLVSPPSDKNDTSKYTTQFAYNKVSDSAVGIVCYTGNVTESSEPASQGTGIIITKDGYIATNSHVIGDSRSLYNVRVVLNDGTTYEAKIIGYDSRTDLAVLKVSAKNLIPATFCDSDKTEIGDDVIAIGNPGGMDFQNSLTKGIISAKDRELSLSAQVSYIQTDAAINPGNSGGPLCNMYGQVIGINTAKISDSSFEGMGFAIPSQTAKKVIDDLIHQGYVGGRVRIGISGQAVTEAMKQYYNLPYGILIGEVTKGGPCDGTDLKTNDVMTAIDGEEIKTFKDVYAILEQHAPGDEITLSVYRSDTDKEFEIKITLQADEGQTQQ